MADKINSYPMKSGKSAVEAAQAVQRYLSMAEHMQSQLLQMGDGTYLVQARAEGGSWKQIVGMDKAISVKLRSQNGNILCAEVGNGKWIDKGLVMTVSMFVLWPLTVTSGVGMYMQSKLPEKIFRSIREYLEIYE